MTQILFEGLNDPQKQVVENIDGPLLVLAGAGSGKTKVLTHRIAYMIASGIRPNNILAITFTNKAAEEMKIRMRKLLDSFSDNPIYMPTMGTFHSICVRILRQEAENFTSGIDKNFVIFDTNDSLQLIQLILKEKNIDPKITKPRAILSHISSAKNSLRSIESYCAESNAHSKMMEILVSAAKLYQQKLSEHNAVDFDDLLKKTVELFQERSDILENFREKWPHILIDEYQDTNVSQYQIIKLLSEPKNNVCAVGDDYQSIYSFRGADFRNILNFQNDFHGAEVIKLEQNYRSAPAILENANTIIEYNKHRATKNLWTDRDHTEPVYVSQVGDGRVEAQTIAQEIENLMNEKNIQAKDCAILYRINAQSQQLEEALIKKGLPYRVIGGTRFFDRREIKDVMAYVRLIANPRDDISCLRIINTPSRKIGNSTIALIQENSRENNRSIFQSLSHLQELELNEGKKTVLQEFYELIESLREESNRSSIKEFIQSVINKTGYLEYLHDGTSDGEDRQQNVRQVLSVAAEYDDEGKSLIEFLEGISLLSDSDNHDKNHDAVVLMTIHNAKGLEFPYVFLPGWESGIFPSSMSQYSEESIEEERRLAYVAITRAMHYCHILCAKQRLLYGRIEYRTPSPFLAELSNDHCEILEGMDHDY